MLAFEQFQRRNLFERNAGSDNTVEAPYPGLDMDSSYNPFDSMSSFHPLPFSYFDNPGMFASAPAQNLKPGMTRSMSSNSAQHFSQQMSDLAPGLASNASVPSASSSTVGSPYSGPIHNLSHEGIGADGFSNGFGLLPTIVHQEGFSSEFAASAFDSDMPIGQDKLTGSFVGECADLSSSQGRSSTFPTAICPAAPVAHVTEPLKASLELLTINTGIGGPDRSPLLINNAPPSSSVTRSTPVPASSLSPSPAEKVFKSPTTPASAYPKPAKVNSPDERRPSPYVTQPTPTPRQPSAISPANPMQQYAGQLQSHFFAQSSGNFMPPLETAYPSLITGPQPFGDFQYSEQPMFSNNMQNFSTMSPVPSPAPSPHHYPAYGQTQFSAPITHDNFARQQPYLSRRTSIGSYFSGGSQASPCSDFNEDGEKGRCPYPDCGKVFKDLKAHLLTHQNERPEKCPIVTCEYNQKGFARKYDKNRHTLTHYKGTMVCGFCPGSGSAAEKSFNRADVFKRHLTSVHGVEQTPPNSRKRSPASSSKKLSSYCQDATGKCSTCSATFNNAQDFYEHLDDCVLRVVQQEEPSEAINAQHLGSIAEDKGVQETLDRHMIKTEDSPAGLDGEEDDEDEDDDNEDPSFNNQSGKGSIKTNKPAGNGRAVLSGAVTKSTKPNKKGLTWSKGGVALVGKGRKKRKHYPPSWGMSADKMQMKKRVLCVYDGDRRLWKDDMMLHNEFEVRMKLPDGNSYVTDLDVETMKRAEAFHNATDAEKGPWMLDDMSQEIDLNELMA